jgi:hypothetical protein
LTGSFRSAHAAATGTFFGKEERLIKKIEIVKEKTGFRIIDPDSDFNYPTTIFEYQDQCNKQAEKLCLEGGPGKLIYTGWNYYDGRFNVSFIYICVGLGEFVIVRTGSIPYENLRSEYFKYERKG